MATLPRMTLHLLVLAASVLSLGIARADEPGLSGKPWPRHVIDDSSRGADGVRLADVNGDGRPDIATGWEEGGVARAYLHPGVDAVRRPWPAVTVGRTPSVEDAVLVDLDGDGHTDVVSSCEGSTRTVFVHWAPQDRTACMDQQAWNTEPLPASRKVMAWMFCVPLQVDRRHGVDLVLGGKGPGAAIGWFESPADPRRLDRWRWHPIGKAGWIMSLVAVDMDGDGDRDILATDRKGALRGCRWLENPGPSETTPGPWKNHFLGGRDHEVMFLAVVPGGASRVERVFCATRDNGLVRFTPAANSRAAWQDSSIVMPGGVGTGKGVAWGDIDRDGQPDLVFSCENAHGDRHGVAWLSGEASAAGRTWKCQAISGPAGIKFDRLELCDLDEDGDLDVLTCEESHPVDGRRRGLGVIWYENPSVGNSQERKAGPLVRPR